MKRLLVSQKEELLIITQEQCLVIIKIQFLAKFKNYSHGAKVQVKYLY